MRMDLTNFGASEDEAAQQALILTCLSAVPMVLKTAIELDLLELIAKEGPEAYVSPSTLAAQLPTHNPDAPVMLDRILRLLSTFSILKCSIQNLPDGRVERLYGLAPVCKFFTKNADGVSFAAFHLMTTDKVLTQTWHYFKEAILDGGYPFKKVYGMDLFEYLGKDLKLSKVFNEGLSDCTEIIIKKILETYDGFKDLKTLIDVGGGVGVTLNAIVSKYPTIKGINFDLPHVIQDAPIYPGIEHVCGDMFADVPQGDAIFMKGIIHDWDDDKCVLILKRCYESLPEKGKVILAEFVLPESPVEFNTLDAQQGTLADVLMLAHNPGAKERTEKDFEALAKAAGFKHFRKICSAYAIWILELHK